MARGGLCESVGFRWLPCGGCLCLTLSAFVCDLGFENLKKKKLYYLIQQKLFNLSLFMSSAEKEKCQYLNDYQAA